MAGRDYNPARYKTRTSNDELQSDEVRKIVQLNARISFLERQLTFRDKDIKRWKDLADGMADCLDSSMDATRLLEQYEQAVRDE